MAKGIPICVLGMVLLYCALVDAQSSNEVLDECEDKGREAGGLSARSACAILTSKCPPPVMEAAFSTGAAFSAPVAAVDPTDLLQQVLRDTCVSLFQTTCKNAATTAALQSNTDPTCGLILRKGPGPGSAECPDTASAVQIFRDALDVCEKVPSDLPGNDGSPDDDSCECTKNGLSGGVSTGKLGCGQHLLAYGNEIRFCYVKGGDDCESAEPSQSFPGAYWIRC